MDIFSRFHWLYTLQRKFPHHVAEHLFKIFQKMDLKIDYKVTMVENSKKM